MSSILADEPKRFPALSASNLNGEKLSLPNDLGGQWNLVLIAFQREQQRNIDTWLAPLPKIQAGFPQLAYYELPTISRLNPMARWFIDNGMRGGIPDKRQRARTITLYIDKKPFREALGLPSEQTVYALLLDKSGTVVWRASGDYTEEHGRALQSYLSSAVQ